MQLPNYIVQGNAVSNIIKGKGLYPNSDIRKLKYESFSRFGRMLDGHDRLNDCREYLFFVKPDLHIAKITTGNSNQTTGMEINPELEDRDYFMDLVELYPDVVRELQLSAPGNGSKDPFSRLLSFTVNSNLSMPGVDVSSIDGPSTVYGTSIEYMGNSESSNENHSFDLEFVDSKELEVFHFFKAYQEYQIAKKYGIVRPPHPWNGSKPMASHYTKNKVLHNTMGIYKFIVSEDMETLIYWAYFWGVYPTSYPRDSFNDPSFDGLSFSVSFKAAFVEDMTRSILTNFNSLMGDVTGSRLLRTYSNSISGIENKDNAGNKSLSYESGVDIGQLAKKAHIVKSKPERGHGGRPKYKLLWYV